MAKTRKTERRSLVKAAESDPAEARTNEFDGLTEEARHDLAVTKIRASFAVGAQAFLAMGRVVVDACYDGDEQAALDSSAADNERFVRLVRTLGTIEGGPNEKTLSNARRVAAARKIVRSAFYRVLPVSHQEELVVLDDPAKIGEGAKRAVEFSWTVLQLRAWARGQRVTPQGDSKVKARGVRLQSTSKAFDHLARASEPASLERLATEFEKLPPKEREKLRARLDAASAALSALRRRLLRT